MPATPYPTNDPLAQANADQAGADPALSQFVYKTSEEAARDLLLDLCRRFKGIDPEVDARIDAKAAEIVGNPLVKSIPAFNDFEPKIPNYYEGEPGEGKTSLVLTATQWFCDIAGLRLVMDPPDNYRFGPKDVYYFSETLAGQTNAMAIGGLPTRAELYPDAAFDFGGWAGGELVSKARTLTGLMRGSVAMTTEQKQTASGGRVFQVTLRGDAAQVRIAADAITEQLVEQAREMGHGFGDLSAANSGDGSRALLGADVRADGTTITVAAPPALSAEMQYVSQMLPNRRFAMANKAKFTVVNFDDIANVPPMVRNVLLEIAQKNRYAGIVDLGRAAVTFTGNIGYEDGTNTMSEQSDAEVTRVNKVRIRDTPSDWAGRMARKYGQLPVGDCYFSSFIEAHGHEEGIFRPLSGELRAAKGVPKPTARSLENALAKCLPWFMMAHEAGVSPSVFREKIHDAFKATAGSYPTERYMAFLDGMVSQAIPLAQQLLNTGRLDRDTLDKRLGSMARVSELGFEIRFTAALVDAFVKRIGFSPEAQAAKGDPSAQAELIAESVDRMAHGLSHLSNSMLTQAMSQVVGRLGANSAFGAVDGNRVKLNDNTLIALADGFKRSIARGDWGDDSEQAKEDFSSVITGALLSNKRGMKAAAPR